MYNYEIDSSAGMYLECTMAQSPEVMPTTAGTLN